MSCIAFIPARSGSSRLPDKNIMEFFGHPLIAYSIRHSIESGIFTDVVVVTDSQHYADIALSYGASVPALRPASTATTNSPDSAWLTWIYSIKPNFSGIDNFAIIRPSSPFRNKSTIQRAYKEFLLSGCDSLRAVEKVSQHPGKMWRRRGKQILPLLPFEHADTSIPWHNSSMQSLPEVYIQNASLEVCKYSAFLNSSSISGDTVSPFFTNEIEGFDINYLRDIYFAEFMVSRGLWSEPKLK